jgi:hypoxanthine phosphoribosyltransferase
MARIYISATYADLASHREAVYNELRKLGHDVVAMEDYVAGDERPQSKCLSDVENCDILVGIVAWRYGHRPSGKENPRNYSITELEIRHALGKNKACLCFLLDEDQPWHRSMIDDGEDGESVLALRTFLQDERVVSKFRDCDSLMFQVAESIKRSAPFLRHPHIAKLLPEQFEGNFLSGEHLLSITEKKLYNLVTRTDFVPELIVGINQGGTLAAVSLSRLFRLVPMGIVQTQKQSSKKEKEIAFFSLPRRFGKSGAGSRAADIKVNQILVMDAKFKSGSSVVAVDSLLREKYGNECDIRYGFIIAYAYRSLNPTKWNVVNQNQPWYFLLPMPGGATGYVAYYTNIDPDQVDPIHEEYRHYVFPD